MGGSNALGMWGYLEGVHEQQEAYTSLGITDITAACGSGATLGGLALGVHLARLPIQVHAYGVCDSEVRELGLGLEG